MNGSGQNLVAAQRLALIDKAYCLVRRPGKAEDQRLSAYIGCVSKISSVRQNDAGPGSEAFH